MPTITTPCVYGRDTLNSPLTIKEIELITLKHSKKKYLSLMVPLKNFSKHLKKELPNFT
jgi:hypothetical protein